MILKFIVKNNDFSNIKQIAKEHFHLSDRLILKLKNKQLIFKNKNIAKINDEININDIIEFNLEYDEENDNIIPTKMDLNIVFEDDSMIIIDKPPFIPIHPSIGHFEDSLSNGVKYYFNQIGLNKKIRPVIRLDKDTSGLVIFAKNEFIQEALIKQMKTDDFKKYYIAFVEGKFEKDFGTIDLPIARKEGSIIERQINPLGQKSITHYKTINIFDNYSEIEFLLETGRTHQIRIHSKALGHPLIGDTLYGNYSNLINRQALHAYKLEFIHPLTKENMNIQIDLPLDMKKLKA